MKLRHLFLSPHFDDAVGSCGGTIARLLAVGDEVRIVTLFGGVETEPFSLPARILHEEWNLDEPVRQRRLEDASACVVLGCESSYLEFPDAIYRRDSTGRHLYPTFDSLRGDLARADDRLAESVAAALQDDLSAETVVYCPMAIGAHVDHVVARDCGRILETWRYTVVYYRDFYYDRESNDAVAGTPGQDIVVLLTPHERDRKFAAFSEYKSQLRELFGGPEGAQSYFAAMGTSEMMLLPRQETSGSIDALRSTLRAQS